MNTTAEITPKGELCKKYLAKYYPAQSLRSIAMKIYSTEEGRNLFKNFELIRSGLRYYVGSNGNKNRGKMADRTFMPDNLPVSRKTIIKHYTVPKANKSLLVLADIHAPFHDEGALSLAIQYGLEQEIDTVILNGDIIDFYSKSRFESDYTKRDLAEEIYQTRDILYTIREQFPNALIVFKSGNHENRWKDWLNRNELAGLKEATLESLLHFHELGIIEVGDKATIWAGKLAILHGHEHKYGMIAPVNPARGLFLRTKQSALMGHVHRVSEHTEKAHDGKMIGCWSIGCLCELQPDYSPYNNFGHGFAHVILEKDGMFTVMNKKIINGKIY